MLGVSFDSIDAQAEFAETQSFPYSLLSDADQSVGEAYATVREEGDRGYGAPMPKRISYLISPDGNIARAYDLNGSDLSRHADELLADIAALS